jgi:hypothetical protein
MGLRPLYPTQGNTIMLHDAHVQTYQEASVEMYNEDGSYTQDYIDIAFW